MSPSPLKSPILTREESRLVDRIAIEEYGLIGLVLMENAGRGVVDRLERIGIDGPVAVCCGKGNNAGDGFVIARHLLLRGHEVAVHCFAPPSELTGDAAANYSILEKSNAPIVVWPETFEDAELSQSLATVCWIVDALLGTGAKGSPRPPVDRIIRLINEIKVSQHARIMAIDLPSGLDCETGEASPTTIHADATCTFVSAKTGFQNLEAAPYLGNLHILDIGAPRKVVEDVLQKRTSLGSLGE
jgi:NAD(P)H-hydrate epimerase